MSTKKGHAGLIGIVLGVLTVVAALALLLLGTDPDTTPRDTRPDRASASGDGRVIVPRDVGAITPPPPGRGVSDRRLPVAGAEGHFVVIRPDGTSYLETPEGVKELVDKTFADQPDEMELADRIAERLRRQGQGNRVKGSGQLTVLERGVVEVPAGALITYVGPDKLVALNDDGTATVYHADGMVEVRTRRQPLDLPAETRRNGP